MEDERDQAKKIGLKLWNGDLSGKMEIVYVAAKSRADCVRMINECTIYRISDSYVRDYFNFGCWGNDMSGIKVERGVWIQKDGHGKPERIL